MLDKGKKIASFTMAPVHKGKKTLKLPKLKKGKHKLKVSTSDTPGLGRRLEVRSVEGSRSTSSSDARMPVTAGGVVSRRELAR